MSRYEQAYGTDWNSLDQDEAVERAYALGVAASLGEYHREELEAIRQEMNSAYKRSVVDLAYEEGKSEAKEADAPRDDGQAVWNELVIGEEIELDPDEEATTGGPARFPEAMDITEALSRPDRDSTEPLEYPKFLKDE